MAKLYWRVKVNGKWTFRPVHWLAEESIKDELSGRTRVIKVYNWRGDFD
jgi:hypothetical protein